VLIPILYLKGISTGDFEEALAALVGKDAPGLSASTIARLKAIRCTSFRTCADGVKNTDLKEVFDRASNRCRQAVSELQAKVRSLGGNPETSGSVSGTLHRGWVNIESTIIGMDDAAILTE